MTIRDPFRGCGIIVALVFHTSMAMAVPMPASLPTPTPNDGSPTQAETPQQHVHHMSHSVMPFEMSRTMHVFAMTETGGVLRVIARDPRDADQISLIQQHLKNEAERFQRGDYSDPATLHGKDMPGLEALQAGASHIEVAYTDISAGGEIRFSTSDLHLLTAIHRWFGAQLSEHGSDARAE